MRHHTRSVYGGKLFYSAHFLWMWYLPCPLGKADWKGTRRGYTIEIGWLRFIFVDHFQLVCASGTYKLKRVFHEISNGC